MYKVHLLGVWKILEILILRYYDSHMYFPYIFLYVLIFYILMSSVYQIRYVQFFGARVVMCRKIVYPLSETIPKSLEKKKELSVLYQEGWLKHSFISTFSNLLLTLVGCWDLRTRLEIHKLQTKMHIRIVFLLIFHFGIG